MNLLFHNRNPKSRPHIAIKIVRIMLLVIVPLNLLCILSSLENFQQFTLQTKAGLQNLTDVYMTTIDEQTERADLFLYNLLNNSPICLTLERYEKKTPEYENAKYQCFKQLSAKLDQETMISGYFLIPKSTGDCILSLQAFFPGRKEVEAIVADTEKYDNRWHVASLTKGKILIRTASARGFYYGAILDLSSREKELAGVGQYDSQTVSFDEAVPSVSKDRIQAYSVSGRTGLVLSMDISRQESYSGISFWNRLMIFAAFLFLLAGPVLYCYLKKQVVAPVRVLNEAFIKVESGDRQYLVNTAGETREFQDAYDAFNEMVRSMEDLRIDNMKKALQKKQVELDNLRLQIRPHFLLNTFNLMYSLLRTPEGTKETRNLILYLSDYFRYLLRSDHDMEQFDKEVSLIEGYVRTAQLRYPGGLEMTYRIDPEVRLILVPPLLIHNFVENVVKHALTVGKCVHIVLTAHLQSGKAVFVISDDGCGMPEDQVRIINEKRWELDEDGHVGIRNAVRRLEALYGEEGLVKIQSEPGTGTVVTISFPASPDPAGAVIS